MITFINRDNQEIKLVSGTRREKFSTSDINLFFENFENFLNKKPIYGLYIRKYTETIIDIPLGKNNQIISALKKRIALYTRDINEARFEEIYLYNRRNQCSYSIEYSNKQLNNYYHLTDTLRMNDMICSDKKFEGLQKVYVNYLRDKYWDKIKDYSEEETKKYNSILKNLKYNVLNKASIEKSKEIQISKFYYDLLTLSIDYNEYA